MFCPHCGSVQPSDANFCKACGGALKQQSGTTHQPAANRLRGFSPRISDPAFAKYTKSSNRWSAIFSSILAVAAVVGFYIAGEVGSGMDNPGSLYIGFAIGGMFLSIAFLQILGIRRSRTWDGTVEDKKIKKKTAKHQYGDDVRYSNYLEYSVIIRSDGGKRHFLKSKNDDTLYNYYQIGGRVRHHAGLKSFEK